MNLKQIMENNERVLIKRARLIEEVRKRLEQDEEQIIPPCDFCKLDGDFRCAECASNSYEGCNIRDYPYTDKTVYKELKKQGLKLWSSL